MRNDKKPARRSYNDHATAGADSGPQGNPYACSAWGCPLPGSLVIDGSRVCFVHRKVPDRNRWGTVTARVNREEVLRDVERTLRPSMPPDVEERTVAAIADLVPEIEVMETAKSRFGSRYALLLAVQERIEKLCVGDEDLATDGAVKSLRDQFRAIRDVMRRVPE